MNYNDMTVEELLLLNSIDVSKFKKEISFDKLFDLKSELDLYGTYKQFNYLVIGKHKISFKYTPYERLEIEKFSDYLKNTHGFTLTEINERFDEIKAKRKELKGICFEVLDADRIGDIYDEDWRDFTGSLGSSCMRGKGSRYDNITSKLKYKEDMQIATLRNSEGKLQARSLVWVGAYFDTIYANDNSLSKLLRRKLSDNGYKCIDDYDVEIQLTDSLYDDKVPYMDRVMYYDDSSYILNTSGNSDTYEFQNVDGYVWNREECACCGDRVERDDVYILHNGDYVCEHCYCNGEIAYAEDAGDYYYIDDLKFLEDKKYYVRDAYIYCVDRNCYYSEDYDNLYYAVDDSEYYSEDTCLYYAEDTYEWYVNSDNLYYTVDTELYYRYNDDLYYYNGEYYDNKPEGYEGE